jgi:hypothetical protein
MYLRRCLSIGLLAAPASCGLGVSGLGSVSETPHDRGSSTEPSPSGTGVSGGGSGAFDTDDQGDSGPSARADFDAAAPRDASADGRDGSTVTASVPGDAEVADLEVIGCPDRAACPAGQVCCAQPLEGGAILGFDEAGALETSCRSSCTAGTAPLCASDSDCGDAGGCFKDPPTSSFGFCAGAITPYFPTFPIGDSAVP